MTLLLEETTFWDVVWWMFGVFLLAMVLWVFISVFGDIFRRRDLSGWGKAGWIFLIFVLPLLGVLIYMIARPAATEEQQRQMHSTSTPGGPRARTADIEEAYAMLQAGQLTQQEFDEVKARALS